MGAASEIHLTDHEHDDRQNQKVQFEHEARQAVTQVVRLVVRHAVMRRCSMRRVPDCCYCLVGDFRTGRIYVSSCSPETVARWRQKQSEEPWCRKFCRVKGDVVLLLGAGNGNDFSRPAGSCRVSVARRGESLGVCVGKMSSRYYVRMFNTAVRKQWTPKKVVAEQVWVEVISQ